MGVDSVMPYSLSDSLYVKTEKYACKDLLKAYKYVTRLV